MSEKYLYKEDVKFHDDTWNLATVEIRISERNWYPEFSMCWDYSSWSGQCLWSMKPKTDAQEKLITLWDKYHLNGMNAGTEVQQKLIHWIKWKYDYKETCEYLKTHNCDWIELTVSEHQDFLKALEEYEAAKDNLEEISVPDDLFISAYAVRYEGKPYLYWHGWIVQPLPDDIIDQVKHIVIDIESDEEEYNDVMISEDLYDTDEEIHELVDRMADEKDIPVEKLLAICEHCEVSKEWLDNVEKQDYWSNWYDVEWFDWLVCTDEEADEENEEWVMNLYDDIGDEWLQWDSSKVTFEDWYLTVHHEYDFSDRGQNLNGRDWYEHDVQINGTTYYLYKR